MSDRNDRNDTTSKPHARSDEDRRWLANALATWVKPGDIAECDCCEAYCLEEHVRIQYGSMGKEARLCPECDLPEHWSMAFSKTTKRAYYIHFDPIRPDSRIVQWSHPNPESPLFVAGDEGETRQRAKDDKKRRRACPN